MVIVNGITSSKRNLTLSITRIREQFALSHLSEQRLEEEKKPGKVSWKSIEERASRWIGLSSKNRTRIMREQSASVTTRKKKAGERKEKN